MSPQNNGVAANRSGFHRIIYAKTASSLVHEWRCEGLVQYDAATVRDTRVGGAWSGFRLKREEALNFNCTACIERNEKTCRDFDSDASAVG